jgi:acyl-CoA thioester hydrolase
MVNQNTNKFLWYKLYYSFSIILDKRYADSLKPSQQKCGIKCPQSKVISLNQISDRPLQNGKFSKKGTQIKHGRWHTARVGVQVADTDYGGGVYHGRYFNLYDQARDQFWETIGVSTLSLIRRGIDLTVAEVHTSFVQSVIYGDRLDIRTRMLWYREKSMGMAQEIMGVSPDSRQATLRGKAEINLVCTTKGKAVPLPRDLVRAIKAYYDE